MRSENLLTSRLNFADVLFSSEKVNVPKRPPMHCNNSTKIGKKEITCVLKAMEVTKRKRRMQQPIQQPMQLLNHDLKEKEFTCVLRS